MEQTIGLANLIQVDEILSSIILNGYFYSILSLRSICTRILKFLNGRKILKDLFMVGGLSYPRYNQNLNFWDFAQHYNINYLTIYCELYRDLSGGIIVLASNGNLSLIKSMPEKYVDYHKVLLVALKHKHYGVATYAIDHLLNQPQPTKSYHRKYILPYADLMRGHTDEEFCAYIKDVITKTYQPSVDHYIELVGSALSAPSLTFLELIHSLNAPNPIKLLHEDQHVLKSACTNIQHPSPYSILQLIYSIDKNYPDFLPLEPSVDYQWLKKFLSKRNRRHNYLNSIVAGLSPDEIAILSCILSADDLMLEDVLNILPSDFAKEIAWEHIIQIIFAYNSPNILKQFQKMSTLVDVPSMRYIYDFSSPGKEYWYQVPRVINDVIQFRDLDIFRWFYSQSNQNKKYLSSSSLSLALKAHATDIFDWILSEIKNWDSFGWDQMIREVITSDEIYFLQKLIRIVPKKIKIKAHNSITYKFCTLEEGGDTELRDAQDINLETDHVVCTTIYDNSTNFRYAGHNYVVEINEEKSDELNDLVGITTNDNLVSIDTYDNLAQLTREDNLIEPMNTTHSVNLTPNEVGLDNNNPLPEELSINGDDTNNMLNEEFRRNSRHNLMHCNYNYNPNGQLEMIEVDDPSEYKIKRDPVKYNWVHTIEYLFFQILSHDSPHLLKYMLNLIVDKYVYLFTDEFWNKISHEAMSVIRITPVMLLMLKDFDIKLNGETNRWKEYQVPNLSDWLYHPIKLELGVPTEEVVI
jgi:hypothetical protein